MEDELKTKALNMGSKGQYELRKTIIRMLKVGKRGKQIAKDLGVREGHVSNVKKLYANGGAEAQNQDAVSDFQTRKASFSAV